MGTSRGGIKAYSEETNEVETIVNSTEFFTGLAWYPKGQQLYFSPTSEGIIYRANADGSQVVTVLNSSSCKC